MKVLSIGFAASLISSSSLMAGIGVEQEPPENTDGSKLIEYATNNNKAGLLGTLEFESRLDSSLCDEDNATKCAGILGNLMTESDNDGTNPVGIEQEPPGFTLIEKSEHWDIVL